MKIYLRFIGACCFIFFINRASSQTTTDPLLRDATLETCVQYALIHQPVLQQSSLDEAIVEKQIQGKLADWYPQLNLNYNLQHNFDLPVSYFSNVYIRTGTVNTSNLGLNVTQNIFNRDVLFAGRTAEDVRKQSKQTTSFNKIDIAVSVSKAFFDVLLTQQQVSVLNEAVTRLERSLKDAVSQYQSGVADKTDYKRATIALNNAKAQRKQSLDLIVAKLSFLKQLMGLPDSTALQLQYDTTQMETAALVDTTVSIQYDNRIEYKLLLTQQRLQQASEKYYRSAFVPTISAFGNYNLGYLNNELFKTYNQSFSNSNIGILLAMPIFQGNKRVLQIKQAELQTKRIDWEMISLKNKLNTQYAQALAEYKGNLSNYYALKENVLLADDVYKTLDLQYRSGVKTYLDVIVAESDLRTAQLNFYNALFQLMQSKLDVQKALGTIQY